MTKSKDNAGKPVAVRKAEDGTISHVQFENRARMTPVGQAVQMTEQGKTIGIRVNQTEKGRRYVQDIPDSSTKDNLANLPER